METKTEELSEELGVDIGEKVKRLRSFRGLTCAELAKMIGCTRPYLSAVENGRYPASTKILRKLQKALGVSLDYFTTPGEPRIEDTTTSITRERVMASTSNIAMVAGNTPTAKRPIPFVALSAEGESSTSFEEYPSGNTDIIECPPDIKDANAFAVRIDSEEMAPMIPKGALAIVAPGLPQRENKPVLVKLVSGEMLCRRFQAKRDTVILAPCNNDFEVRLVEAGDIEWIYPVVRVSVDLYNDPVS